MNEFLEQFLQESRELVAQAATGLLALEQSPENREHLDRAFRAFHTLKGGAGIVEFTAMSRAVHAAEDALSAVRDRDLAVSTKLIDECLKCIDQVTRWLDEIETRGDLPSAPDRAADAIVARFGYGADPNRRDEAVEVVRTETVAGISGLSAAARRILNEQLLVIAEPSRDGREGRLASAARVAINVFRHAAMEEAAASVEEAIPSVLNGGDAGLLSGAIARVLEGEEPAQDSDAPASSRSENVARVLRVDSERVDALVNLTGELAIAKNAIAHVARLAEESGNQLAGALRGEYRRIARVAAGLQDAVLRLRVLPLRTVFQRFSRIVRELAISLEKPTTLLIEGEDAEADKAVVEMLFEPLLHVVRNAMSHGIEAPQRRAAAGKPVIATIRLGARRQGENVIVDVADDGGGMDVARIRRVAAERGIASEEALIAMSDRDVIELVFKPGFSTSAEVTNLSGRGVGMDAVRTTVESIGGRVMVASETGQGSTVSFVLPFSVMMTRLMTVEAAGQMFGIPLDAVAETVQVPREKIKAIGTAFAFVLRNQTIPMLDLAQALGRPRAAPTSPEAVAVITSIGGQRSALEVDRLGERLEVILRPIDGLLSGMLGISGTTLLGNGQVLLVLDLQELMADAGLSEARRVP